MIPEREREALMRLTMCAREECGMCKYKDTCNFDFQYETATRCMNILAEALNADRKTENCSEIPNNCEHITEDGVTCAKYPACDDCLDNPLNKVKGSERLVKGSEQTEPTISKMEQVDKDINVRSKDEQTDCNGCKFVGTYDTEFPCANCSRKTKDYYAKDDPQTERSE